MGLFLSCISVSSPSLSLLDLSFQHMIFLILSLEKKDFSHVPRSSWGYWFFFDSSLFHSLHSCSLKMCLHLFLLLPPIIQSWALCHLAFFPPTTIPVGTIPSKVTSIIHLLNQYLLSVRCMWGKAARAWKKSFMSCSPLATQEDTNKTCQEKWNKECEWEP